MWPLPSPPLHSSIPAPPIASGSLPQAASSSSSAPPPIRPPFLAPSPRTAYSRRVAGARAFTPPTSSQDRSDRSSSASSGDRGSSLPSSTTSSEPQHLFRPTRCTVQTSGTLRRSTCLMHGGSPLDPVCVSRLSIRASPCPTRICRGNGSTRRATPPHPIMSFSRHLWPPVARAHPSPAMISAMGLTRRASSQRPAPSPADPPLASRASRPPPA